MYITSLAHTHAHIHKETCRLTHTKKKTSTLIRDSGHATLSLSPQKMNGRVKE